MLLEAEVVLGLGSDVGLNRDEDEIVLSVVDFDKNSERVLCLLGLDHTVGHFGEEDSLYLFAGIGFLGSVEESGVFFLELCGQCLDGTDDVGMLQNVEFLVHFDVRLPV